MNIIRPSADLRNKYAEISKQGKDEQKPIYITVNGRNDTVLINQTVYEQQMEELELLKMLAEAESDVNRGDVIEIEEAFKTVKSQLNKS
ncbi:type II toxin-antitoxin system Phd/YefM family antitoxin [Acholeplasma laidlawii]|uniref:type II toxin-antitoxin system prevent-host-death family antitoxin n=1 Tax=Acholeplasma laidlawii TaxID=2148 RepID=UPI0018C26AA0|nr:type II toxin-antitoxin system prevent-host-death family antitoxin [Acholeplasma laidlawii]MBG0762233.1 type II toxin-antitoxin system Phd/YefM family antitoxin [Acholeplasma laidlawii]